MQITEVNTLRALRDVLESEASRQDDLFRERVMEPLRPVWENMLRFMPGQAETGDPGLTAARMLRLYLPELGRERALDALDRLERAHVWEENLGALRRATQALRPDRHGVGLREVHLALTLADPEGLGEEGYTGAGNTPGWVVVSVWPREHNLSRLPAVTAHEFNHNVRFQQPDWTFPMTLGAYLVAEGLAEAFAAELCGAQALGSWTTALGLDALRQLRPRFQAALYEQDFDIVRGYVFGDSVMGQYAQASGTGSLDIPPYAGYALGYQVVQDYLTRTGRTAAQATYDPWRQIVDGSGWFTA